MSTFLNLYRSAFLPLVVATVAFVFLCMLIPEWFYNPPGWVDGWAYNGLFIDFLGIRTAMSHMPQGDLLPLILSGKIFYALLSPYWANLVFKFMRFILAAFFIFRFSEIELNRRSALIILLFTLFFFPFLIALRTDYTDGAVILYLTAALFCTAKAYQLPKYKNFWLCMCGACFAFSVFSALLSIITAVSFVVFIIYKEVKNNSRYRSIINSALWPLVGFLTAACLIYSIILACIRLK